MCTVTFIPKSNSSFVLTSNRDEAPGRATIAPAVYKIEDVKSLYPRDVVAGGTWIGVSEKKRLICLLNGGFEAHKRKDAYQMSRGIVVKNLLIAENLHTEIEAFDFDGVEPFTVIAVEYDEKLVLFELVWDGTKTHFTEKPLVSTIWSSSLLYTPEMKRKREQWFARYLNCANISKESILNFHKTAGEANAQIDLIMDRDFVKTKSITQVVANFSDVKMRYEDIQNKKISEVDFNLFLVE